MNLSIQDRFNDKKNQPYKNFLLRDSTSGKKYSNLRYLPDVGVDHVSGFLGTEGPIFKQLLEDFNRKNPEDLDIFFDLIDVEFYNAMNKIEEHRLREERKRERELKIVADRRAEQLRQLNAFIAKKRKGKVGR
tara:strand:- start:127 stop:525 length:399 start_codon:yes stop_codon:yes gene_type:complete